MSDTEQRASIGAMYSGDSTAPHVAPVKHPYFCIESEMVAIQVENTLFNIHKQQLCHSETFKDLFSIKQAGIIAQGSTLDNPIKLLGISALDFESLLIALYAHRCPTCVPVLQVATTHPFDPRHITPAFRLADMWNFTNLCNQLAKLAAEKLDVVEQAMFAGEFGLSDMLEQAYLGLCQRDEPLTSGEASKLGFEGFALVGRLREESCRRFYQVTSAYSPVQQGFGSSRLFNPTPAQIHHTTGRWFPPTTPATPKTSMTERAPLPSSEEARSFLLSQIKQFVNQGTSSQ